MNQIGRFLWGYNVDGHEVVWLVGHECGEGLVLVVLCDGGHPVLAAAYPANDGEDERAEHHGSTAEEEGGHVTSCDVDQPACRRSRSSVH